MSVYTAVSGLVPGRASSAQADGAGSEGRGRKASAAGWWARVATTGGRLGASGRSGDTGWEGVGVGRTEVRGRQTWASFWG